MTPGLQPGIKYSIQTKNQIIMNPKSGDHLKFYTDNCVQLSSSTMSIDLFIQNDGANDVSLNSLQIGLNLNDILNGGTPSWALKPGTSELPQSITSTFSVGYSVALKQLKLNTSPAAVNSSTAPILAVGAIVKVGTFIIINTQNWVNGTTTDFKLEATAGAGHTLTGALIYDLPVTTTVTINTAAYRSVATNSNITFVV